MKVILGIVIGITMMCLLQANRTFMQERKIEYLKKVKKTNSKGKSEYDKGYSAGIEYACTVIEEEM